MAVLNQNHLEPSRVRRKKSAKFSGFDRALFMYIRTTGGVVLWNRSRSMLSNGYRPSAVALHLFQNFGVQIDSPSVLGDPSRDEDILRYFSQLVIPDDAIGAPSIFDDGGRA